MWCILSLCLSYNFPNRFPWGGGGAGGKFRVGKIWAGNISAPPKFGALCTVAETTVLGIHNRYTKKSGGIQTVYTKSFFAIHRIQKKCFGMRTSINTDPGMQYTGTSTLHRRNWLAADAGSPDCAKNSGVNFGTNLKNEISTQNFAPAEIQVRKGIRVQNCRIFASCCAPPFPFQRHGPERLIFFQVLFIVCLLIYLRIVISCHFYFLDFISFFAKSVGAHRIKYFHKSLTFGRHRGRSPRGVLRGLPALPYIF